MSGTALVSFIGGPLDGTGGVADCSYGPIHLDLPWQRGSYVFAETENDGEGAWLNYEWKPLAEGEEFPDEPAEALVSLTQPARELRRLWNQNIEALINRAREGYDADEDDLARLRDSDTQPGASRGGES